MNVYYQQEFLNWLYKKIRKKLCASALLLEIPEYTYVSYSNLHLKHEHELRHKQY